MEAKEIKHKIKRILSEFLGVEPADINDDDDFLVDLKMEPTAISDFQEKLVSNGVDADDVDFNEVSNVNELAEILTEGVVSPPDVNEA